MDDQRLRTFVERLWDEDALLKLAEYVAIPCVSPFFDPAWAAHREIDRAVDLFVRWAREKIGSIDGAGVEVCRLEGRTPVILIEIPGKGDAPVLLYGHLDKQPAMTGWRDGFGPWTPVIEDGRLYGRGGADDGYALFGALGAIMALREQGVRYPPCRILIETCEESGSYDLPAYIDSLASRIGEPSLVVCLDSGCGNYDQLWLTTSLRGLVSGILTVSVLEEGVHSGDASGIVPSSFRILRSLISRIEDEQTGRIKLPELDAVIPVGRRAEAEAAARVLGTTVYDRFPWRAETQPVEGSGAELILNRTWRAALAVTGLDGGPKPDQASNVLRTSTAAALSLRLPPTVDANAAAASLKRVLEQNPPYRATVEFVHEPANEGWNAPALRPDLHNAINDASRRAFGRDVALIGEGGSIPFMAMLGDKFPNTQFVITGVLGPGSNAHGPNEFLDIATVKNVTFAVAAILSAQHLHDSEQQTDWRDTARERTTLLTLPAS